MQVPCCNDNIHGFPHHLAPSAFTFIKLLRERETCFHQKFLVCPEACMTQKTLVLGQMISLVIPGENQLRNKPEDYGFISLYSSLSEEALLIFVMFLPFQVDAKRVIFHIILVIIVATVKQMIINKIPKSQGLNRAKTCFLFTSQSEAGIPSTQ